MKNAIRKAKDRKVLSIDFLKRAVQDFAEIEQHKDLTMSEIFVLRLKPTDKHYMQDCQSRYAF